MKIEKEASAAETRALKAELDRVSELFSEAVSALIEGEEKALLSLKRAETDGRSFLM